MTVTWRDAVTLTVEVGFASNPSVDVATTTWTDISAYVRGISTKRGRNDELGTFSAGTMQLTLSNADRRFDPNYASSPYSPNVLPMRRVRFKATYNAVTYAVWSGFVNDWPQQYDISDNDGTVTVGCTDGFKVMSLLKLPESVYFVEVMSDTPVGWWRLGEQSGTVSVDSSGFGRDGVYGGGATFASRAGLIADSSNTAIEFDGVNYFVIIPKTLVTDVPATLECWVSYTTLVAGELMSVATNNRMLRLGVNYGSGTAGCLVAMVDANGGLASRWFTTTTAAFNDGLAHHVVAVFTTTGASPTLYVDGQAVAVSTTSSSGTTDFNANSYIGVDQTGATRALATIDEVAVYNTALSAGAVTAHYDGGSDPWAGDTTGARVGRYLDLVAWPAGDRTVATGISTVQHANLQSSPVISALQDIEASEQGQLFMGADGKVVFRDRHWRFENSAAITSQATFGDSGAELKYADIETDGGEQFLINHVRASRDGGAVVDVSDATSVSQFYERVDDVSGLQNESDLEVRDLANWRLATKKNPILRVVSLAVKPRRSASTLFPQVLGRDIGERLTVKRRPQGVGSALAYTVLLEGVDHTVTKDNWVTQWYLSSSDSQSTVQPLILDDATFGILDTNILGF